MEKRLGRAILFFIRTLTFAEASSRIPRITFAAIPALAAFRAALRSEV